MHKTKTGGKEHFTHDYPVYGVQFHPESNMTPDGKTMLENFIEEM